MAKNINNQYITWLSNADKPWSAATIGKYESAVRMVSKEMLDLGVINKSLYDMNLVELDISYSVIFQNPEFIKKNTVGNKMYSNGLKQYRSYISSVIGVQESDVAEIVDGIKSDEILSNTEKEILVASRVGQGKYRKLILNKYKKCVVTGVDDTRLLIASHIKPWSSSNNYERINENNGLLLTPTFDKLFDEGLITFSKNGEFKTSSFLSTANVSRLLIPTGQYFDLKMSGEMSMFLEYHNDVLFVR
ncbi:MAG: HNH endonuclease [Bacillota bacterium]